MRHVWKPIDRAMDAWYTRRVFRNGIDVWGRIRDRRRNRHERHVVRVRVGAIRIPAPRIVDVDGPRTRRLRSMVSKKESRLVRAFIRSVVCERREPGVVRVVGTRFPMGVARCPNRTRRRVRRNEDASLVEASDVRYLEHRLMRESRDDRRRRFGDVAWFARGTYAFVA